MEEIADKTGQANGLHVVPFTRQHYIPSTLDEAVRISKALFMSGAFNDIQRAEQAFAKILAGMEIGIGPMAALMGIHFVQGKPGLSATLIGTLIQQSRIYSFFLKEHSDQRCVIHFYRFTRFIGESSFSMEDARKAQLVGKKGEMWEKYPRNMLFARAISNGARWYCPEVFGGAPVYTPEELDADLKLIEGQTSELDTFISQAEKVPPVAESEGKPEGELPFSPEPPIEQSPAGEAKTIDNPAKRERPVPPAKFVNVKAMFSWLQNVAKISEKETLSVLGFKGQMDVTDPMGSCLAVLNFFWPANSPEGSPEPEDWEKIAAGGN